jgi:hypothetical protein
VVIDLQHGPTLHNLKFVEFDGVRYVAVLNREDHDALADAGQVHVLHGNEMPVAYHPVLVRTRDDKLLLEILGNRLDAKYCVPPNESLPPHFFLRLDEAGH